MMRADIVAQEMDGTEALINLPLQRFQRGNAFPLPLPVVTVTIDLTRTGVKGSKQIQGTCALILMLGPVGNVLRLCWQGGGATRARLQRGLLIHGEHQLIVTQRARIELDEFRNRGIEGRVPGLLGIEPDMLAPRLQLMRDQNPPHSGGGDLLNDPRGDELPRQFGAIPLGQTATQRIRAFAGQVDHVDRDLRGKNHPWPRGQGRRRAPPDAGPESAWPTYAPPSVGRPPSPPRQIGSSPRPGGG